MKISAMEEFEFIDFTLGQRTSASIKGKAKIVYVPLTSGKGRYSVRLNKELTDTIRNANTPFLRLSRNTLTGELSFVFQKEWTQGSVSVNLSDPNYGIINSKGLVLTLARILGIPLNSLHGRALEVSPNKSRLPNVVCVSINA